MIDVRPIRNEADYDAAIAEIAAFDDNTYEVGTPASDRLDILVTLVQAYEAQNYAIPKADPIDVLRFAIEDMGRSQVELAQLLGSKSRASEVLNRRRLLTLEMIRAISEAWSIPIAALAGGYLLVKETSGKRPRRKAAAKRPRALQAA